MPSSGPRSSEQQLQEQLIDIADKVIFGLTSGSTIEYTGLPIRSEESFNCGVTTRDTAGNVYVALAFEMLEPLMRGHLTSAEIKMEYFRVSITLLHEFAVRIPSLLAKCQDMDLKTSH